MKPNSQMLTISIELDFAAMAMDIDWLDADSVSKWIAAAKESGREFASDVTAYLMAHPMVKSTTCSISES